VIGSWTVGRAAARPFVRRGRHRAQRRVRRPRWLLPGGLAVALVATVASLAMAAGRPVGRPPGPPGAAAPASGPRPPATPTITAARPLSPAAPAASGSPAYGSPAYALPAGVAAGAVSVTWQGVTRRAVTSRPAGQRTPLPTVLVLHGRGSSALGEQRRTHLDALAARGEAVVVYPPAAGPSWDAGSCCSGAAADDSGYLNALTATLISQGLTDRRRVYAVGFSVGAMMAFRLACDHPTLLAGIGSVGGVLTTACPASLRVPLVDVHSRRDPLVPIGGTTRSALSGLPLPAIGDVVEAWRRRTGCTGRLYATPVRALGGAGYPVEVRDVPGCPPGGAVRLLLTQDRAHRWPQAAQGLDTTGQLWSFLRMQQRAS